MHAEPFAIGRRLGRKREKRKRTQKAVWSHSRRPGDQPCIGNFGKQQGFPVLLGRELRRR